MSVVQKSGLLFTSQAVRVMKRTARPVLLGISGPLHLGPLPIDVFFRCGSDELLQEPGDDRQLVVPVLKARVFPAGEALALLERWPFVTCFGLFKERRRVFLDEGTEVILLTDLLDPFGDVSVERGTKAVVSHPPYHSPRGYSLKLADGRIVWAERDEIARDETEIELPAWGRDPNFEMWEVTTRRSETGFRRVEGPVWSLPASLVDRLLEGRRSSSPSPIGQVTCAA